jgi:hypothetical protein
MSSGAKRNRDIPKLKYAKKLIMKLFFTFILCFFCLFANAQSKKEQKRAERERVKNLVIDAVESGVLVLDFPFERTGFETYTLTFCLTENHISGVLLRFGWGPTGFIKFGDSFENLKIIQRKKGYIINFSVKEPSDVRAFPSERVLDFDLEINFDGSVLMGINPGGSYHYRWWSWLGYIQGAR